MEFLSEVSSDEIWSNREKYFSFLRKDTNMIQSFDLLIETLKRQKLFINEIDYQVGDIGCGTGWAGEMFCSKIKNSSLFLVDTSLEFKYFFDKENNLLLKNKKSVHYKKGNFANLPFEDSILDVLIYNASIHHETNLYEALKESSRVLKKDGILIISNEYFLKELDFIFCFLKKNIRLLLNTFENEKFPQSISNVFIEYDGRLGDRYYRRRFFKQLVKDIGFLKLDIIDTPFKPYKKKFTEYKLSHFIYKKI